MNRAIPQKPPSLDLSSLSSAPIPKPTNNHAKSALSALISPRNVDNSTPRGRQPLVSPRSARTFTPRVKSPRAAGLQSRLCGDQWAEVQRSLKGVEGLAMQEAEIVATSKLDEQALDAIAAAIGILMKRSHSEAACTLIRMCKPALLLALLEKRDHVTHLNTSGATEVRKAVDETLGAGAWPALQRDNFPRFFKLLSYCSPEARANKLAEMHARLRAAVERVVTEQPADESVNLLREIASLCNEINTKAAMALRFDIMRVLSTLPQEWQTAFESSGRSHLEVLQRLLATSLPTLCDAAHSHDLDSILGTDQGRRSTAQAAIGCLSSKQCSDATMTSLFAALAHRVDLSCRSSLPTLDLLESRIKKAEFGEDQLIECTHHLHQWLPGWRLLLAMNRNSHSFREDDKRLREAAVEIDAAAAGASIKAAEELATRLDGWVQDALAAMLNVSVAGRLLLSDDALRNVMCAVVGDKAFAESTANWINEHPEDQRVKLYARIARALVSPPLERSLSESNAQLPANDAASYLTHLLISQPDVAEAVQSQMTRDEWKQLWILASTNT